MHFYCHIEDVNDNEPKFARMSTTDFSIREDAKPGTLVAQFKASDADSGEFGSVFYRILSGDEGKFRIDSQTVLSRILLNPSLSVFHIDLGLFDFGCR